MQKSTTDVRLAFQEALGDISELAISVDQVGITDLKGIAITGGVSYKITIRRNERPDPDNGKDPPPKYLYSGTISMIDPENNRVLVSEERKRKRNKAGRDKDCYASRSFRSNENDAKKLASKIRNQIDDLFEENKSQYEAINRRTMTPDQVTPLFACYNYLDGFLAITHPNSRHNDSRKRNIQKVFSLLPNVPFKSIKKREVTAILQKNSVTSDNTSLCRVFVEYLKRYNKIEGGNPFPPESPRQVPREKMEKDAFTSSCLSKEVFAKLFHLMNKKASTVYCGIALLASGFPATEVLSLKWSDIDFVSGYEDFAIAHIRRDQLIVAKHDFSRPVIPDCALYLRKVYNKLTKEYGEGEVRSWHIVTTERSRDKPLLTNDLALEVNDLLVRAGYNGRLAQPGRPTNETPIPISLLINNYRKKLIFEAGLASDGDTYNFLCGTLLKTSTYTNYLSHTSPEASYRLYKILKPLSVETRLTSKSGIQNAKDGLLYLARPNTNHEIAQLIGSIDLKPGQSITVRVPSGVTGTIDITQGKEEQQS